MTKTIRVALLSAAIALFAAPVFADPGGGDPPPPPPNNGLAATTIITGVLSSLGL